MIGSPAGRRARALLGFARPPLVASIALLAIGTIGVLGMRLALTSLPARTALLVLSTVSLLLRHRKREDKGASALHPGPRAPDAGTG